MPKATFETPDGDDLEIDPEQVSAIRPGEEEGTVAIELEDGSEVTVIASELEVAADLGLNPLEVIDPEDDDESIERLVEEGDDAEKLD